MADRRRVQVFWAPRPEFKLHSLVGRGADGGSGRPWALTLPDRVPLVAVQVWHSADL